MTVGTLLLIVRAQPHQNQPAADSWIPTMHSYGNAADFLRNLLCPNRVFLHSSVDTFTQVKNVSTLYTTGFNPLRPEDDCTKESSKSLVLKVDVRDSLGFFKRV